MSYQALARKYRPQRFSDIIGQETTVRTLQNAIESGRIHHAYLFSGVRGVGKTTADDICAPALGRTWNGDYVRKARSEEPRPNCVTQGVHLIAASFRT